MNRSIKQFGLSLLLLMILGFSSHKYYLSLLQVNYEQNQKALQITLRVFLDDLQTSLREQGHSSIELGTDREPKNTDRLCLSYLRKNLVFEIENNPREFNYLGKEYQGDQVVFYLEILDVLHLPNLFVKNTLLYRSFPNQKNLVKISAYEKNRSVLLTKEQSKSLINF